MAITDLAVVHTSPVVLTFTIDSTGVQAGVVAFTMPFKMRIDAFEASVRAMTGVPTSMEFDLNDDGGTVLSSDLSIPLASAGTITGATINSSAAVVAKGSVMTIDAAFTAGSSPTGVDITLVIVGQRQ